MQEVAWEIISKLVFFFPFYILRIAEKELNYASIYQTIITVFLDFNRLDVMNCSTLGIISTKGYAMVLILI